ncbi:uncharacterized protein [Chelonus insularis]|uniref:uncharacterized protein n=1 Tax=Chelonus insularis TaxID=460826 RepID=UPI00158DA139|nr:uncharacterized protein LOC118066379 [Chelonus insularis]
MNQMEKIQKVIADELHRPARNNFKHRKDHIQGLDETWQADLVDLTAHLFTNSRYKYILTIIDIFSKYAWAVPVKTKNGKDVTDAMISVLIQKRVPQKLHVDRGKEFYNKEFQTLMERYNIEMYSTFTNLKASICERFNRT